MKTRYPVLPDRFRAKNKVEGLRTGEYMARRFPCEAADCAAGPVMPATHGAVPDPRDGFEVAAR